MKWEMSIQLIFQGVKKIVFAKKFLFKSQKENISKFIEFLIILLTESTHQWFHLAE